MQGKKFLGVNCGTNDAKVVTLTSTDLAGKRTYKCACKGTINSGASDMYCSIHYWECPAWIPEGKSSTLFALLLYFVEWECDWVV